MNLSPEKHRVVLNKSNLFTWIQALDGSQCYVCVSLTTQRDSACLFPAFQCLLAALQMGRSHGVIFHGLDEVLRSRDDVTDIFEGSIVEKRRHVAQNDADHVQLRDLLLEHLLRDCQCNEGNLSQENTQVGHHVSSSWNIISCVRAKPEAPPPRMQFLYFARSTPQCTPSVHTFLF